MKRFAGVVAVMAVIAAFMLAIGFRPLITAIALLAWGAAAGLFFAFGDDAGNDSSGQ